MLIQASTDPKKEGIKKAKECSEALLIGQTPGTSAGSDIVQIWRGWQACACSPVSTCGSACFLFPPSLHLFSSLPDMSLILLCLLPFHLLFFHLSFYFLPSIFSPLLYFPFIFSLPFPCLLLTSLDSSSPFCTVPFLLLSFHPPVLSPLITSKPASRF